MAPVTRMPGTEARRERLTARAHDFRRLRAAQALLVEQQAQRDSLHDDVVVGGFLEFEHAAEFQRLRARRWATRRVRLRDRWAECSARCSGDRRCKVKFADRIFAGAALEVAGETRVVEREHQRIDLPWRRLRDASWRRARPGPALSDPWSLALRCPTLSAGRAGRRSCCRCCRRAASGSPRRAADVALGLETAEAHGESRPPRGSNSPW